MRSNPSTTRSTGWARLAAIACAALLPTLNAATVAWKAAVSGNWNDATKWSTGTVPASGDSVVITNAGTYTVTVNVAATVGTFTVDPPSGTATVQIGSASLAVNGAGTLGANSDLRLNPGSVLGGSGDITASGKLVWSGGQIEGAGKLNLASGAAVTVVTGGQHNLRDRQVVNATTVTWSSVNNDYTGFGATWKNESTGTLELKGDVVLFYWGGTPLAFQNNGFLKKTAGTGTGYLDWNIANAGFVGIDTGTLNLRQGGTLSSGWQVASGATLAFAGGTFSTHASTALSGAGRFLVTAGNLDVAASHSTGVFLELAPGGTLQGAADLTLTGKFLWSGGQVEGAGKLVFAAGATVDVVTGGQHNLRDRPVVNATTVNWSSVNGDYTGFGATWKNEATGVLDLKGDAQVYFWGGTPLAMHNGGLLRKSAGTGGGGAYLDWNITNAGVVAVNSGLLNLRQGGTLASEWQVAANAALAFAGGTFNTHASTVLSGAGRFVVTAGFYNVAVSQTTGVFLELAPGGTLQGAADLTLTGKFLWSGGQVEGTGKLTFASGSTVDVVTGGQHNLRDRQVVNATTVTWSSVNGDYTGFGAKWINGSTGTLDLKGDAQVYFWGGTPVAFQNNGTLRKSAGTGAGGAYLDWTIANGGVVAVDSGLLNLRQGGTLSSGWQVASGATLAFAGGTFTTHASTAFSGAGRFLVTAGFYNVAAAQNTGVFLELAPGGTLQGAADLTLTGKFVWSGGQVEGAGKLTFANGAAVDVVTGGQHNLRDRPVVNATTVNWSSLNGDYAGFAAKWTNEATGTLDLKGDAQVYYWGGTPVAFQNNGTLRKSAGTGPAGGYLDWNVSNAGTVELAAGTLNFRYGYAQTAGLTRLAGGNAGGNILFDIKGGAFEGSGLVNGVLQSAAVLRPGNPLGRLNVGVAYTNTPTARTLIQVGGKDAGTNADQVVAVGPVKVAGELSVEFANGFVPAGSESWVIVAGSARAGTFGATNAPAGYAAELAYTPTNVTLRLVKTAVAAPVITSQPVSTTVDDGSPATFTVVATGADLAYQWRRNGVAIPGATAASYTIDPATFSKVGKFSVIVSNAGGSVTSDDATLAVNPTGLESGLVARYPLDGTLADVVGGRDGTTNGTLAYVATGARNSAMRLGGQGWVTLGADPSQAMVDPSLPFSASFWIRPRALREMVPVRLATPEGEFAVYLGSGANGGLATHFGFRGQNSPATTDYRATIATNLGTWTHVAVVYKGGGKSDNASFAAYINGQAVALDGQQTMTGGNGANELGRNISGVNGWVEGDLDEVRVYGRALRPEDAVALAADAPGTPPEFITQPVGYNPGLGAPLSLGSLAIGNPLLAYQWFRDGTPIDGATGAAYNAVATAGASGTYWVEATNGFGKARSSNAVVNVVIPPPPGLAGFNLGIPNYLSGASFLTAYYGAVSYRGFGGGGGGVYFTANGGTTWTASSIGVPNDVNAVQLVGPVAYIAGNNGLLCISTNAGATWRAFVTGTTANFQSLCFATPTSGWAVGSAGTICRYNGVSWIPFSTGTLETFYGVAYDGGGGGVTWAVGSGGTICRYNGTGWFPWITGTSATFYGVAFYGPNLGFAVGSGGTICRYNGSAWVPVNSGTTGTFRTVTVADAKTVYAAGDNGLFCVSRDGGLTWTPLGGLASNGGLGALAYAGGRVFLFGAGGAGYSLPAPGQAINLPPTVQVIQPTNNATFFPCRAIPLVAVANDPDGTVAKVEFFRGQFKLAEFQKPPRFGAPFYTSFDTDALAVYELRAVATDNLGAVTISDPVRIDVVLPPAETGAVERVTDDGCALCFFGIRDQSYVLEATTDPITPAAWVPVSTNSVPEPFLRVTDTNAPAFGYRFYRWRRVE